MNTNMSAIRIQALEEVRNENFRAAVNLEKERIRSEKSKKSLWQRLTEMLPFTITRKSK